MGLAITFVATAATVVLLQSRPHQAIRVHLRPVGYVTPHPFTESVSMIDPRDASAFARSPRERRAGATDSRRVGRMDLVRLPGDHEALYGSRNTPVCDKAALVAALRSDRGAARAWAGLMGVRVDRIEATVDALTPVVLGHDTAVTNHEYRDGRPRPLQDILQAGTPVLVDGNAAPRVQCSCGNPLRPTATGGRDVEIVGERWDGFRADQVVSVEATPSPVGRLQTIDVDTGDAAAANTEGTVRIDGLLVSDAGGVHVVSEDGKRRTTVIDHPVAAAFDDGAGGVIYNEVGPIGDSGVPTDSRIATERTPQQAAIWHLAAGAPEPVVLIASDRPSSRWAVAGAVGILGGRRVLAYLRMQAVDGGGQTGDLVVRDLDTGREDVAVEGAMEPGVSIGSVSVGDDHVGMSRRDSGYEKWVIRDSALKPVAAPCEDIERRVEETVCPAGFGVLISSPSTRRPALFSDRYSNFATGASAFTITDLGSGDSASWFVETGLYDEVLVDALNGHGLLSLRPSDGAGDISVQVVDLGNGATRELPIHGLVRFLRAPIVRPALPDDAQRPPLPEPPEMRRSGPTEYTIEFTHPGWGRVRMIVQGQGQGCAAGSGPVNFRIVDRTGRERYRYDNEHMFEFAPAGARAYCWADKVTSPVDAAGTIFLDYNPGRYNGVIALRPTVEGFEDFGTLPPSDSYDGRFYYATPIDADDDGIFEVEQFNNDCIPDCAGGTITSKKWRLRDDDFVLGG